MKSSFNRAGFMRNVSICAVAFGLAIGALFVKDVLTAPEPSTKDTPDVVHDAASAPLSAVAAPHP